jgi:hypothetical protein
VYSKIVTTGFLLFVSAFLRANGQAPALQQPDIHEKRFAVDLVRVINTAEMSFRDQHNNSFAPWDALTASPGFQKARDTSLRNDPMLGNINTSNPSEVVAGWRLRLAVAPDSKSYVVVLANTSDKNCGYAVVSDEEGLIREARAIGCSVS